MRCGEWKYVQIFQVTWPCPYKLWWKTSKIFFFGTKRPMTLKLGIQHRVLEYWQYFIWWPCVDRDYFYDRVKFVSECFCMGESIQHWVLMYFQVCSHSTYPQDSGERYRTNGPLVFKLFYRYIYFYITVYYMIKCFCQSRIFSSPEPKAHWWAYTIGRPLSSVVCLSLSVLRLSSTLFKHILLRNRLASQSQISYEASMEWGNERFFKRSRSHNQDGRHAHIW